MKDTFQKVGGDPARKLSLSGQLISSFKPALEEGITLANNAVGATVGLYRY